MSSADSIQTTAWSAFAALLMWALTRRFFRRRVVGDLEMLQLGATVYIAVPFIVFGAGAFEGYPGIELWSRFFEAASKAGLALLVFSMAAGAFYWAGRSVKVLGPSSLNQPIRPRMMLCVSIALWLFWASLVGSHAGTLGQGYGGDYDFEFLGQLGTINLMSTILLLNANQFNSARGFGPRSVLMLLVANSLALLSLGGRMYVFASVVALLLQKLSVTPGRGRVKLLGVAVVVVGAMLFIGLWRIGQDIDASFFMYIAVAEPIFTSMSLGSFVDYNGIPMFAVPYQFFGSIVNFIPSAFFPNKLDFIPTIQDAGLYFESPMGALNVLVSLIGNFGWVGAMFFSGFFGMFMNALRRVAPGGWWLYFYVCALLPFMFFRDGFSIFNKAVIFNGIILPYLILKVDRFAWPARRSTRRAQIPAPLA